MGSIFEVSCYPSCMNNPTESMMQQAPEASSHVVTPKADTRRIYTVVIRVSADERAALKDRCPPEADLSTWMRTMCLGLPTPDAPAPHRRPPTPPPSPNEAVLLRARALMSLAQATSDALRAPMHGNGQKLCDVLNAAVIELTEVLP